MSFLSPTITFGTYKKAQNIYVQGPETDILDRSPDKWPVLTSCQMKKTLGFGFLQIPVDKMIVHFLAIDANTAASRLRYSYKETVEHNNKADFLADSALVVQSDFYQHAASHATKPQNAHDVIKSIHVKATTLFKDRYGNDALTDLENNWKDFSNSYAQPCFFEHDKMAVR